jgi:hypothetical protein
MFWRTLYRAPGMVQHDRRVFQKLGRILNAVTLVSYRVPHNGGLHWPPARLTELPG